jgi:hypothetical protein
MNKKVFVKIAALLLLVLILVLVHGENSEDLDLGWYEVADWEVAVCTGWGGIADETRSSGGDSASSSMHAYNSLTVSAALQAEIVEAVPGEYTLPEGTRIYAISWYVQPISGSINYKVKAIYSGAPTEVVQDSSATPSAGYNGYFAKETDLNMTKVVLEVPGQGITLEVPVVG